MSLEDSSIDFAKHKEIFSPNLFVPTLSFLLVEIGQQERRVNEYDYVITLTTAEVLLFLTVAQQKSLFLPQMLVVCH